jgi:hypothetical protein
MRQPLKKNAGVDDKRLESDIKRDVEGELRWDPELDAIDIGVTVHNGVMTRAALQRDLRLFRAARKLRWPAISASIPGL